MAKKADTSVETPKETEQLTKAVFYQAVGRRKEASARVRLYLATLEKVKLGETEYEKGAMVINGRPAENYFPGEVMRKLYLEPLRTTNNLDRFVISALIEGGGLNGQLTAFMHGMSRALLKVDEKFRPILKKNGFLTRDPRAKQRRKAGFAGKSRKRKQSPKR
jgi:small subunit ribosomal protein S9